MIHELFVPKGRNDVRRACRIGMFESVKEIMGKLVIDGNCVYEIDEDCIRRREEHEKRKRKQEDGRSRPSSTSRTSPY